MIDPYPVGDFRRIYFDYFSRLYKRIKTVSLEGMQLDCLLYFVEYPVSSAYNIKPPSKTDQSSYRWAKLTVKQLHRFGLIELAGRGKHSSNHYSLTDEGIYYLIKNTKLPYSMGLQDLIKSYSNSNIFQYLVYPYIKLETLCSPKMDLNILAGVGHYLVSILQGMERTLLLLEKQEKSYREIYYWNYDKLEEYLRNKYHYDFLDSSSFRYCKEDWDGDRQEIRYTDFRNDNKEITIVFDKSSKKGYVYDGNKRVKKHEIPLITDYLQKRTITQYDYNIGHFDAFCSPRGREFISSIFSTSFINTSDDDIREILSNDRSFMDAVRDKGFRRYNI